MTYPNTSRALYLGLEIPRGSVDIMRIGTYAQNVNEPIKQLPFAPEEPLYGGTVGGTLQVRASADQGSTPPDNTEPAPAPTEAPAEEEPNPVSPIPTPTEEPDTNPPVGGHQRNSNRYPLGDPRHGNRGNMGRRGDKENMIAHVDDQEKL